MATISSITEVRRVIEIGFDYEPGTTGNPVTTSVTYDGQDIQVTVQLPSDCPEPDECDCEDLELKITDKKTQDRIKWSDTGFTGDCMGGSRVVEIVGTSGSTSVNSTVTVNYSPNDGMEPVTRTTRLIVSGSPVTIRVTIQACEPSECNCDGLFLYEPSDDEITPTPVPTSRTRWVTIDGEYECDSVSHTKYSKERKRVSTDGGSTWSDTDETRRGYAIEYNSQDCGYVPPVPGEERKIVSGDPYCLGDDFVVDTHEEVSYDGGITWQETGVTGRTVVKYGGCTEPEPGTVKDYLRITSVNPPGKECDVLFSTSNPSFTRTIEVSTDNGATWNSYVSSRTRHSTNRIGTVIASLQKNQYVLVRGTNSQYSVGSAFTSFHSSGLITVEGNIMSLVNGNSFDSTTMLSTEHQFDRLFHGNDTIVSAEGLKLPSNTTKYCYRGMFIDCNRLETPPKLPATELSDWCYSNMFNGCSGLLTAPELPANELKMGCYTNMFYECQYVEEIKCMATRNISNENLNGWLFGVSETGRFIKKSGTTWETGADGIPSGWTVTNI